MSTEVNSATATARPSEESPTAFDEFVTTRHQIRVASGTIHYSAHAGLLPLLDNDTGELMARMFIVAYTVDRAPGQSVRPVTFIWNGGPGANSSLVHLLGYGPKIFKTPATYPEWGPGALAGTPVDNPDTWLDVSDLVFVDPVGTGYSRATSKEYCDLLYTTHGDGEAVAEMIRLYRTRFNAWEAPLFIAGESYGTTRAMEVAANLERRRTHLAGVMLVSGFYNTGQQIPAALNTALQVPLYTVTAHHFKLLPADLQAASRDEAVKRAEHWARTEYAPALEKREGISRQERRQILDKLQRYTGIDPQDVVAQKLSISSEEYLDYLLADRGLEIGRYDTRVTGPRRPSGMPWKVMSDPTIAPQLDLLEGTSISLIRYIRDELRYKSDLLYRGPFGGSFHPLPLTRSGVEFYDDAMSRLWDHKIAERGLAAWEVGGRSDNGAAGGDPTGRMPLRAAMEFNPRLLVFIAQGMYDGILGISCASKEEAVARTNPGLRNRIRTGSYAGGHFMFTDRDVRRDMKRDFASFVREGVEAARGAATVADGDGYE